MRKMLSIVFVVVFVMSFSVPVFADSLQFVDPKTGLPFELAIYSDAYIEFTKNVEAMGGTVTVSIESFVKEYKEGESDSLDQYIEKMVKEEESKERERQVDIAKYEDYQDGKCVAVCSEMQCDTARGSSIPGEWYDNIINEEGEPELDHAPWYGTYRLMTKVKQGDIVWETSGSILTVITGHIAIVEGKFYDTGYYQYYIRTIEATTEGVVYGVLDDCRVDDRGITVLYVNGSNENHTDDVLEFCVNQIGKPYNYAGALGNVLRCNTSETSTQWYCTELVWAAYFKIGVNLNNDPEVPYNTYFPSELAASTRLLIRSLS